MRFLAAIAVLLVAGCSSPATPTPTVASYEITGTVTLTTDADGMAFPPGVNGQPPSCHGANGFDDMKAGTGVTIKDQTGTIVATAALQDGTSPKRLTCVFAFAATVPTATFYSIEVSHRGAVTYSFDQMTTKGWVVALTLGT